jgi:hypothetical protein
VAVAALATFALRGQLGLAPLVATAVVLGSFDALFTPSMLSSVPQLVAHPGELQATNGLIDVTRRLARALGPGLAGAVAAFVSIGWFFALDAVSFAASAVAVASIGAAFRWRNESPPSLRGVRSVARQLREGVEAARAHASVVWGLATLFLVNATWCAGFQWGGELLASRVLRAGMSGYGFLIGAYGVGNVLGNLVFANIHIERRIATMSASRVVLCVGFLILATAPSLPIAMLGAAIAAVGGPMGELPFIAILQTEIPRQHTGRVFGLRLMIEHAGVATGLVLSAPLFATVPVRVGIASCALALGAGGVAGLVRFGTRA